MELHIQSIVLISCSIVLGNFLLFLTINIKNKFKNDLERYTFFFWLSVIPIFIIGSQLENLKLIPFVTIISVFTTKSLRNFWCGSNYKPMRERFVLSIASLFFIYSIYAYINIDHPFFYAIPISIGLNLYLLEVIYCAKFEKKAVSVYQKLCLIPLYIGLYNNFSPVLGQQNIAFDVAGWSTALIIYQFISILMPLIILDARKEAEKENLEKVVEQKTRELVHEKLEISQKHKEAVLLSKENEFLFNTLSHDIATPVQTVDLFIDQALRSCEDDKIKNYLTKVSKHIETIVGLIKSTKIQRQMNAKKNYSNKVLIDVDDSLKKCVEVIEPSVLKKNLEVVVKNSLPRGVTFLADPSVFVLSILGNILSNAVKFTPVNGKISIKSYKYEGSILLEIRDSGAGISLKKIEQLHKLGYMASTKGTLGEEGSGFGLSNTFRFVELYDGNLTFENTDKGTLVVLSFPIATDAEAFYVERVSMKDSMDSSITLQ